jgi:hypothetical protein
LAALFYAILQHRNWSGAIFRKENLRPSLFWNLYLAFLTVPTTLVGTTKLSPTFVWLRILGQLVAPAAGDGGTLFSILTSMAPPWW